MSIVSNEKIWIMGSDGLRKKSYYEYDGKYFDIYTKNMQRFNIPDLFSLFISIEK